VLYCMPSPPPGEKAECTAFSDEEGPDEGGVDCFHHLR